MIYLYLQVLLTSKIKIRSIFNQFLIRLICVNPRSIFIFIKLLFYFSHRLNHL